MNDQNQLPDDDNDDGVLTAYGAALARLIVMALRPMRAERQTEYMALMSGIRAGDIRLRLTTEVPINQPGSLVLTGIDSAGTEKQLATLKLSVGSTN